MKIAVLLFLITAQAPARIFAPRFRAFRKPPATVSVAQVAARNLASATSYASPALAPPGLADDESTKNYARAKYEVCLEEDRKDAAILDLAAGLMGKEVFLKEVSRVETALLRQHLDTALAEIKSGNNAPIIDSSDYETPVYDFVRKAYAHDPRIKKLLAARKFATGKEKAENCDLEKASHDFLLLMEARTDSELGDREFSAKEEALQYLQTELAKQSERLKKGELAVTEPALWYLADSDHLLKKLADRVAAKAKLADGERDALLRDLVDKRDEFFLKLADNQSKLTTLSLLELHARNSKLVKRIENEYVAALAEIKTEPSSVEDAAPPPAPKP